MLLSLGLGLGVLTQVFKQGMLGIPLAFLSVRLGFKSIRYPHRISKQLENACYSVCGLQQFEAMMKTLNPKPLNRKTLNPKLNGKNSEASTR